MEMDTQNFIDQINDEQFKSTNFSTQRKTLEQGIDTAFQPLVDYIIEQINSGYLAQARLDVIDADTEFRLETSIINLPLRYGKAISKIMSGDGVQPINVYMIIESPDVNRSSLRIDEVASATEFTNDAAAMNQKISQWAQVQLTKIDENIKASAEEEAETK